MENDILKAIELLKSGQVGKVSKNIFTVENAVVFRDVKESRGGEFKPVQEVIVIKTNSGVILGNSSRMAELEDQRFKKIIQPARIQRILSDIITMIPFTVFKEAGLDLLSCEIIDSGPAETLKEKRDSWSNELVERHFTGARLFKAETKVITKEVQRLESIGQAKMTRYFLVDADRREVEHNIVNFFLAEIPFSVTSIKEAYDALKPKEVVMFEQNTGATVDRQGEFFFIPTSHLKVELIDQGEEIRQIRVGNSRPNTVTWGREVNGAFFVTGIIRHSGREHAPLQLREDIVYRVVPNTSKANFQLTGDID